MPSDSRVAAWPVVCFEQIILGCIDQCGFDHVAARVSSGNCADTCLRMAMSADPDYPGPAAVSSLHAEVDMLKEALQVALLS